MATQQRVAMPSGLLEPSHPELGDYGAEGIPFDRHSTIL
jgi:hypothetical protein